MTITKDTLTWMFVYPEWRPKFLIGSLQALAATFVPVLGLACLMISYGYVMILMRAALGGEPRVLPKWQVYGTLFLIGVSRRGNQSRPFAESSSSGDRRLILQWR